MQLHLVSGFLGSGKTTAIAAAARWLMQRGKRVGVVTNDQGRYLVDTAFFRLGDLPAVEVTGGCFCCNYDDLDARLTQLVESYAPDVVFAESVGSCADLVATVLKPLLELRHAPASLSVFADARLLRFRLLGYALPFSDDILYIFDKQIEEAGLLVINKADLLNSDERREVEALAREVYPQKNVRLQNSLDESQVAAWVGSLRANGFAAAAPSPAIDYQRYGQGEAELAWLDQRITLEVKPGQGQAAVVRLIETILERLAAQDASVAHLKFVLDDGAKISITAGGETGWRAAVPDLPGQQIALLVNARVQTGADLLRAAVAEAAQRVAGMPGVSVVLSPADAFHPGFPNPTYRMD
ncbi:MAG: hypothetical protein HXY41_09545 [Chloroflexi bacterium]|nr:hypothetical protein [Chloroflexota bacterium]